MESKLTPVEEKLHHLPPKATTLQKNQGLRRVCSDVSAVASVMKDMDLLTTRIDEAESVECECCGMSEDCTPTYISQVKEFFCSKWICGLCSEAVKDKAKRDPMLTVDEALESHMALCKHFNITTRLNPKLSLAGTMRDITRKNSQQRSSKNLYASKFARTVSCGPRMDVKIRRSSFSDSSSIISSYDII